LRALRRLQREIETSPFVFVSERGSPFTTASFARMIEPVAAATGLELKAHPHMLRHAFWLHFIGAMIWTRSASIWLSVFRFRSDGA
jgi:site-specific recombinase XerD